MHSKCNKVEVENHEEVSFHSWNYSVKKYSSVESLYREHFLSVLHHTHPFIQLLN